MYTPSRQRDSQLLQKSIIRHAEGYTQYTYTGANDSPKPMQYYFYKDHFGNVCAVWNATTDEVVQRTVYYPSGVPMAQSTGQDGSGLGKPATRTLCVGERAIMENKEGCLWV